jgi:hypothetical protein
MAGIYDFLQCLTDTQWDSMIRVIQDLQDSASVERMESLRNFLSSLTREIDTVNRRRDALGQKIENIDILLSVLDNHLKENPGNTEATLFRSILALWKSQLKIEVSDLRPSEKLEKKYDTERKRELLAQLQVLVSSLSVEMREAQAERSVVQQEAKKA